MGSMIIAKHKGSFRKTEQFFKHALAEDYMSLLDKYGKEGVKLLSSATPSDSGETASCWNYKIEKNSQGVALVFHNDHENHGVNVVRLIVYGHGLWNGGYVEGNDFVSPAIQPLMTELARRAWKEVTS